jgi:BlaI family transcriptional regulator, penicillinase repressor
MTTKNLGKLSRRERQIMDVLYESGRATAAEIMARMPDPPGYSAVRTQLRILEEKGIVKHREEGPRYVFSPTLPRAEARKSAVRHLLKTFFEGSPEKAMAAILDQSEKSLTSETLDRLARLIDQARKGEEGHEQP